MSDDKNSVPARGRLILIPCPLGDQGLTEVLPRSSLEALGPIRDFVVENEKTAWRFLASHLSQTELDKTRLSVLDEHTPPSEVAALLAPALEGRLLGLLSEAGCPGVADPGAALVAAAHRAGIAVKPLIGPSSILLALMASGMNGQSFRFCGYLPRERRERISALKALERKARETGETQIFIETPYRNDHLLSDMLSSLKPDTLVCAATDMSLPGERILRAEAAALSRAEHEIGKRPTVFLIGVAG